MLSKILKPIENELLHVESIIAQNLFTRVGNIDKFVRLNFSYTNRVIRPAMTILPARLFGCKDGKVVALASIFQFIYMALKVQQSVAEEDRDLSTPKDNPKDGFQFPVLVGDYLYGKFFYFLSRAGLLGLLEPLAELICSLHEGSLIEKNNIECKNVPSYTVNEAVRKETAEFFASCCRLGARIAGASPEDQHYLGCYGQNFGMAFGLLERRFNYDKIEFYLTQAEKSLYFVPKSDERCILEQIVRIFLKRAEWSVLCMAT